MRRQLASSWPPLEDQKAHCEISQRNVRNGHPTTRLQYLHNVAHAHMRCCQLMRERSLGHHGCRSLWPCQLPQFLSTHWPLPYATLCGGGDPGDLFQPQKFPTVVNQYNLGAISRNEEVQGVKNVKHERIKFHYVREMFKKKFDEIK